MSQPLGRTLSQGELAFMAQHPGGFDRPFFERTLPQMTAAYLEAHPGNMLVLVHTAGGAAIPVSTARVALTWGEFRTESGGLEYVPFREIVRVSVDRRPPELPEPERRPIGFTVESIPDDQPSTAAD
jgi:hypothetical protein